MYANGGTARICGDVVQLPDGNAGIVEAQRGIGANQSGMVNIAGQVTFTKETAADVFTAGALVAYHPTNKVVVQIAAAPTDPYFIVGRVAEGSATLITTVLVDLNNQGPSSLSAGNPSVVPKTADYTVVAATDNGKTFTTVGASGTVTFAMPAATLGQKYRFRVGAAQQLRIDPNGTETIALPSTGVQSAAGAYIVADADGETVDIECTKAGQWSVFGYTGTWTAV